MTDEVIEKIKKSIEEQNAIYTKYHNWEQGTKIMINSFYGGLGNNFMYFFDPRLAECITKQGKSAILYAERNINDYFLNHWYEDTATHAKLGIRVVRPVKNPVTVYIDTDSCDKDTIIHCNDKDRTIEELYNECEQYGGAGNTMAGHESVRCPILVLNQSDANGVYFAKVKRVIRHKVKKKKWKITTKSGKTVIVTNDHSIIVVRNGERMSCKPSDILPIDMLLTISNNVNMKSTFEEIESIECIGEFDDEYVYDIEMDDDTHTFVANDILVHNSVYSQLDEVISTTNWGLSPKTNWRIDIKYKDGKEYSTVFCGANPKEDVIDYFDLDSDEIEEYSLKEVPGEAKDFAIRLDDVFLSGYFKMIFDKYAAAINADNYLNFELETYSDAGIWLAKKKYIQNIRWTDSMPREDILDNFSKIKSKGVELIQASSPTFARSKLTYLVRWIFEHKKFDLKEFVKELKKIRDEIYVANPDDICWNKKATEYLKWVTDDNKELVMKKGTPATTKGIAYYNYLLNNNPKYKSRYANLVPGNKCKYYYCKNGKCEMFAYEPGLYPIEFAPEIDRKMMFEKTILAPINRIVEAIGFPAIEGDLIVLNTMKLF